MNHYAIVFVAALGATLAVSAATLTPVPLAEVRLLPGPFKAGMDTNRFVLDDIGVERALYCFRYQAGIPTTAKPFESWASPEPGGAFPGFYESHYLSACALMYAQTGDTALLHRVNYMVAELAKCQKAFGGTYLFASPQDEFKPERLDGVAWYRMHKQLAGLIDAYRYCTNQQALLILNNLAQWIKSRTDEYTAANQWPKVKSVEYGGTQEALENLFAITRNPMHKALAHQWEERGNMLDPLSTGRDVVGGHANTYLAKMAGAARIAEVEQDDYYLSASKNFIEFMAGKGGRTYATGGTSIHEGLPGANGLADTQSRFAQETCCSYNLLKVTRSVFNCTADLKYIDYYERLLFNSILGCQDIHTGWLTYYQPLNANTVKDFRSYTRGCYCCNGTGLESFSKFGEAIYYCDTRSLYVNLFIASTVKWPAKKISLEQLTTFPDEAGSTIIIHATAPVAMAIGIRVPGWCTKGFAISVNGAKQSVTVTPSNYAVVNRTWKEGDKIRVTMPMPFTTYPMPDKPSQLAFMYGPITLVGLGARPYLSELLGDLKDSSSWINNLEAWFKPVAGRGATFVGTDTAGRRVGFVPYYRIAADEFFTTYWDIVPKPALQDDGNLALGKQTRESSPQPAGVNVASFMRSARAVDGYTGSWYLKWEADGGLPQWWSVDLAAEHKVNKCEWFAPAEAKKYYRYMIEGSMDCTNWVMFADRRDNKTIAKPSYVDTGMVTARYLRVTFQPAPELPNNGWPAAIEEFKAYGVPLRKPRTASAL